MLSRRALAVWMVVIAAESIHGMLRQPERMLADYDAGAGGVMALGLAAMLLSPWLAARLRR